MEIKIHKNVVWSGPDAIKIDGFSLISIDIPDDGDYIIISFERDINPWECYTSDNEQHVWAPGAKEGESCLCGKENSWE